MPKKKPQKIDFAIGGQAVMEGVMMRSPNYIAIAVRKADHSIKVKNDLFASVLRRFYLGKIPIIRGMVSFVEMMIIGVNALNYSAMENMEDEQAMKQVKKKSGQIAQQLLMVFSMAVAIVFGIGLFKFLPLYITQTISNASPYVADHFWLYNIIDGVIKISFFITYIFLIGLLPDLKRVFEYHGAEHKAVRAYEADVELTPEKTEAMSRFHPRCGTSFILVVFLMSIIFYTVLPQSSDFISRLAIRIAVLPIIAGLSYEFLKWSAHYEYSFWMRIVITPGLWLQRLTTREPDHDQLAVALAALKATLDAERKKGEIEV